MGTRIIISYSRKLSDYARKTAFVYGGTRENKLMITYTEDMGATWKTAEIGAQLETIRVKFCSFPTVSVGYVIAAGDRTMSQEGQAIYQTTDGGSSWNEVGYGPSTWLLQYGVLWMKMWGL